MAKDPPLVPCRAKISGEVGYFRRRIRPFLIRRRTKWGGDGHVTTYTPEGGIIIKDRTKGGVVLNKPGATPPRPTQGKSVSPTAP